MPGIDFSNDPLLQGRLFSYLDTQLSRLGSPNFLQLPINAPRSPIVNFQRDGQMQFSIPSGQVNYEPSSREPAVPGSNAPPFRSFAPLSGGADKGRLRPATFAEHYGQATMFYRSLTPFEQSHVVASYTFELSKVESAVIRERIVARLRLIDESLAERVAEGLGMMQLPPAPENDIEVPGYSPSPALRTIGNGEPTLAGRCVAIVIDDDSDAGDIDRITKAIERQDATARILAPKIGGVTLSDGARRPAEGQLSGSPSVLFDAVVLLPAAAAVERWFRDASAIDFARDAFGHLKAIGVNEEGRRFLQAIGLEADDGVVGVEQEARFVATAQATTTAVARE